MSTQLAIKFSPLSAVPNAKLNSAKIPSFFFFSSLKTILLTNSEQENFDAVFFYLIYCKLNFPVCSVKTYRLGIGYLGNATTVEVAIFLLCHSSLSFWCQIFQASLYVYKLCIECHFRPSSCCFSLPILTFSLFLVSNFPCPSVPQPLFFLRPPNKKAL